MPHDAQIFVPTYTKTPEETAAEVLDAYAAAQAEYAESAASKVKQYGWVTGLAIPDVTSISPNTKVAGSAGFVLTVTGADFVATSVVQWKGTDVPTTFVSKTSLTAQVDAAKVAAAGTAAVRVKTGEALSNSVTFTITAAELEEEPTEAWLKADIVAWLLDKGVEFSESALNNMTKAELIELVADLNSPA